MSRTRTLLLLLLPALLLLMGFRQVPLADPAAIAVPATLEAGRAEDAIKRALVKRQWVVNSDEPGKLLATYARREFSVQIAIEYDRKHVQIRYVSSTGLKYEVEKNGERLIHKNYMAWVQNLVTDISGNLTLAGI